MKKPATGYGYSAARAKMVAQQKKEDAIEAALTARKAKATKSIALGSAALAVISLSLFAVNRYRKKRNGFL